MALSYDLVLRVLKATQYDREGLLWRVGEDNSIHLFADCSDTFMLACCEFEEIRNEDQVALLEECLQIDDLWGYNLYACRVRDTKPCLGFFHCMHDKSKASLFDGIGETK